MSSTQKPESLRLADKYEAHGFLGDHRFAKDHWCTQAAAELRSQHARIAELEAQLSAIAHTAEGATAQTETLRAELAEETEAAENWRRLALQFDNHRLQALGHLKAILRPDSSVDEYKTAELFLKAPPLDGESVLARRIAELSATTQAQAGAQDAWQSIESAPKDGTWMQLWRTPEPEKSPMDSTPLVIGRWSDEEESFVWPDDQCYDPFTEHGKAKADQMVESMQTYASNEFTHWKPLSAPTNAAQASKEKGIEQ